MIYELREYQFTVQNWTTYEQLFRQVGWPLRRDSYGILKGAWTTPLAEGIIGFLHLWAYDSLDARTRLRAELLAKPGWLAGFIEPVKPLLISQTLSVLNFASSGCVLDLPAEGHLHRVTCAIGRSAAVVLEVQKETQLVWTTEFPNPNEVAFITPGSQSRLFSESGLAISGLLDKMRSMPLQHFYQPR